MELPILTLLECGQEKSAKTYTSGELPNQPPHFSTSRWPTYRLVERP